MTFIIMTERVQGQRRATRGGSRSRGWPRRWIGAVGPSVAGALLLAFGCAASVAGAQGGETLPPVPRAKPPAAAVADPEPGAAPSACAAQLAAAGADFRTVPPPESGGLGCRIEDPVRVTRIGETRLSPSATLSCSAALKLARFLQRPLAEEVRTTMNTGIDTLHVAASFDCRGRNRQAGAKLSEHGYGRAVDMRGLTFTNGEEWAVSPREPEDKSPAAELQRRVRALACGPFTTVLGPGSDAYHDDHFHFDLAPRNNAYCR